MRKFLSNGRRRYLVFLFLAVLMITLGAQNCSSDKNSGAPALSASKDITAFSFNAQDNAGLSSDVIGSISGTDITATVPYNTDMSALAAAFTTTGVSVTVGDAEQASGATANNFFNSVTYAVTAADGSTQEYTVTVTETSNTAKEITAFSFIAAYNTAMGLSSNVSATISGTGITATVPYGTDVFGLVATFSTSGAVVKVGGIVQTSYTTPNDFTGPVTYTVTAADGSRQDYTVTVTIAAATAAGSTASYTAGFVSFDMVYVPGKSFPTSVDDSTTAIVSNGYLIGETEVTYELWSAVYFWATTSGGYTFANAGIMGDGTGDTDQHPVTTINWRDALVWMNALTEYYNITNSASLEAVYYADPGHIAPIKDSSDGAVDITPGLCDNPYVKYDANGFRLPSSDEWELAGRYKGSDSANGATEYPAGSGNWWTPGNYASGATAVYTDFDATSLVAWFDTTTTQAVGQKTPNALGLYDMSGNVWEWSFDWSTSGSFRVYRGGSFSNTAFDMRLGSFYGSYPYDAFYDIGFRPARTP